MSRPPRFAIALLLLLPWLFPGCARMRDGALTPLDPGQLDERVALAEPGADDDPVANARALVHAEYALGRPDRATEQAWVYLRRAELSWWMAQLEGDAKATHDARRQLDRAAKEALRWALRDDDPKLVVLALMLHPHPRRHRRALRHAVARLAQAPRPVDLARLLELVGDDIASRRQVAQWVSWTEGEAARLGLAVIEEELGAFALFGRAFDESVRHDAPDAEILEHAAALLRIDPWHSNAQLIRLGLREIAAGTLRDDATLLGDLTHENDFGQGDNRPSLARLHLRAHTFPESQALVLARSWWFLEEDMVGDAHATLEAMATPSDPAVVRLHEQLQAMTAARRGEVAAFEHWRITSSMRSPSVEAWLLEYDDPQYGALADSARRARSRHAEMKQPFAYGLPAWKVVLDEHVSEEARAYARDGITIDRGEARAWEALCREHDRDGETCFHYWAHLDVPSALSLAGRTRHFHPDFLSTVSELEPAEIDALASVLAPYEGRVVDASPEMQSARLHVELVQKRYDAARIRLTQHGALLDPTLRTRAWLVLDDLEAERITYEEAAIFWIPGFDLEPSNHNPDEPPPLTTRIDRYATGMSAAHRGEHEHALALLMPVLDALPDEVLSDGLAQAALSAHLAGDARARDLLRHRLRSATPHASAFARLEATLSLEAGKPQIARRFLAHALRWHPDDDELHRALATSFSQGSAPPEALAFITDAAPPQSFSYASLRREIRSGTLGTLAAFEEARKGIEGSSEDAWQVGMPLGAKLPRIADQALAWGISQIESAEDLETAMHWATATLERSEASGLRSSWQRQQYAWLALLGGQAEAGLAAALRLDLAHDLTPLDEGDAALQLLRARRLGEIDDALAWDLWRWIYETDSEASARVEALLLDPPTGTIFEVFACGELTSRDDLEPAYPVCKRAFAVQPHVPMLAVGQLFLAINTSEPATAEAMVAQVRAAGIAPPLFSDRPYPAASDPPAQPWHQNLAIWQSEHGQSKAAAESWWQAYAFGLQSDAGQLDGNAQLRWRGPLVRALVSTQDLSGREVYIRRSLLALAEAVPTAALGYAEAARAFVPEEIGVLTRDELVMPERLRHLASWAAADLDAGRIDAEVVGQAIDLIFDPELPAAQALHESYPESSLTRLALIEALASIDDTAAARPLAEALVARHPHDPLAIAAAIPLWISAGDEDGARALYEGSDAAHPRDALLLYIEAPESITGPRDGVPSWVRDPSRYDQRIATVAEADVHALVPTRQTSDERAAEIFVPRTWSLVPERALRFTDEHGARMMVLTSPRASRCQGEACARDLLEGLEAGGRTLQWVRQSTIAGAEATEALFTNAEEVLVTWVLPSGGRVFSVVIAAPVDRFDAIVPALVMLRDGFRPLDGVLAPFTAESLRAAGPTLRDGWRLRARREQVAATDPEACPVARTLATLRHDHQRAEVLVDLWLATANPPTRRRLLHCTTPREASARRLALLALLDEDPRVHAFGQEAVRGHATQVDADVRTILSSPLQLPVSAPDYLTRTDLPGRGLVEVLGALPLPHAGPLVVRLLASKDARDRTLAWAAVRLRPELATDATIDEALAGEARVQTEAAYLLSDRGMAADAERLRRHLDTITEAETKDELAVLHATARSLAYFLDPRDGPELARVARKIVEGDDAERAKGYRELFDELSSDHTRGIALLDDRDQATSSDDGRALRWRDRSLRRELPFRPESDLVGKSLAQLLPGRHWTFARLAAPGLFSSTVADVVERLTTGDEAVDQRLSDLTTNMLRDGGFAALSLSGGLDDTRPIECAKPAGEEGWLCTAWVSDREALLAVFGQRAWGDDAGISLPLSLATTAGIVPVALSALPAILHVLVYPEEDEEDDDVPAVSDEATERARMTLERGGMSLERHTIIDIDTHRISIDSERYLFLGDRLWVFSTESTMEQVMRAHEGSMLADDPEFQRLTKAWKDGAALQAVAIGRAWSLAEGGASMEVVLDEGGLHFRYAGAFESEEEVGDIGPALAQLPEGAVSIFAHGLGRSEEFGNDEFVAKGADATRVPPMSLLASARGVAFGWYLEDGDHLWRRWLAVAPLDKPLRQALREQKTPPGRAKSRRHGGLCYRERAGFLLVGECALVEQAVAGPLPPSPSREHLRVGHGTFNGIAAAERLPGLGGLPLEKRALFRAVAPLLNIVTDLRVEADWTPAERMAVLEGRVGLRLRPPGDRSRVIDDWLAATEGRNAATLPRRLRSGEIEGPLRYIVEVPDAEDFVRNTLADSPRIEATVLGPTRVSFTVAPVPHTPRPVTLDEDERKRLTKRTKTLRSDDPRMVELARSIAPEGTPPKEAAENISQWVHERITYEVTPRSLDGVEILEAGRGDCTEYSTLTVTLLRAIDVPAELRDGMAASGDEMVAHAWVAYHDGTSWHEIDPTWGRSTASAGHLEMSVLDALALISLGKLEVVTIESD